MLAMDYLALHHDDAERYICIAEKDGDVWNQWLYHIDEIRKMNNNDPRLTGFDKYFSLNTFYRPSRIGTDVRHIRALYVDIDCYNVGLKPHEVAKKLQEEYFEKKIPTPNVITFTGRGINCIWLIKHAPKGAAKSWARMNNYLFEQLKPLGADSTCATDLARVFRLPGSVNSKSKEKVQAFVRKPDKYYLGDLLELYAPWNKEKREKQASVRKKSAYKSKFTLKTLAQARIKDLETLQYLRNKNGVVDGYREQASYLYFYNKLCLMTNEQTAYNDVLEYNSNFIKPLNENELSGTRSYTEGKAEEWKVAYNLKEFRYRKKGDINQHGLIYSNKKIIVLLDITEDEQQFMTTIIGEEEKKRRKKLRDEAYRRKNGQVERAVYLNDQQRATKDKLSQLKELLEANPKAKKTHLAKELGIGRTYLYQLLDKI